MQLIWDLKIASKGLAGNALIRRKLLHLSSMEYKKSRNIDTPEVFEYHGRSEGVEGKGYKLAHRSSTAVLRLHHLASSLLAHHHRQDPALHLHAPTIKGRIAFFSLVHPSCISTI
jgi:hypothetical protein